MPEISRFFGMVIAIFYKDHSPPHFHVKYNDYRSAIVIESLKLSEGHLPKRALSLVLEWAKEHQRELLENWDRAQRGELLRKITPLE